MRPMRSVNEAAAALRHKPGCIFLGLNRPAFLLVPLISSQETS
jgi:hypothetical protein